MHRNRFRGTAGVRVEAAVLPYARWPEFGGTRRVAQGRSTDKKRTVLALAGDAGAFEDMLPHIVAARSQARRLLCICFMNEAGIARTVSGTATGRCAPDTVVPPAQRFAGMQAVMRAMQKLQPEFMATACPSYPFDLLEKVGAALQCSGVSLLAVLTPCPTGCLYDAAMSVHSGRLAVQSGFFPLYQRLNSGAYSVSRQPQRPVADYLRLQQVCPRPQPDAVSRVQRDVDALRRTLQKASKRTA
jgi:pyruvate ferredoxin oxidoreductase beta subunit